MGHGITVESSQFMDHGLVSPFPHFTLGAGRGLTDGLAEPQSALCRNLHRMQYCMRWCLNPAMFAMRTACKLHTNVGPPVMDNKTLRTVMGFDRLTWRFLFLSMQLDFTAFFNESRHEPFTSSPWISMIPAGLMPPLVGVRWVLARADHGSWITVSWTSAMNHAMHHRSERA
jgi:hypothetical protein